MNETVTKRSGKFLSVFLAVLMIISSMPFVSITASADGTTIDSFVITVVNSGDVGISNASVTLDDTTKTTNGDGEVTFNDVAVEDKVITVSANGYADNSVRLVLDETTASAQVTMKHLYTVTGSVKSNINETISNYNVTAKNGDEETTVSINSSESKFSFQVTEGNNAYYEVTAKNYVEAKNTIVNVTGNQNIDIELQAESQTITVTVSNEGTAKINTKEFNKDSSENTIDIDFINNDTFDFSAVAGEGYHVSSISGAINYTNNGSNAEKNAVKSYPSSGVDRVTIDKSKTSQTINVVFEINKYDAKIYANKNYTFNINGTEYKVNSGSRTYDTEFTYGQVIPITLSARGNNNIDTLTVGSTIYSSSSTPTLESLYDESQDLFAINHTVNSSVSIAASTSSADLASSYDPSNISLTDPIYAVGNTYYYKGDTQNQPILKNLRGTNKRIKYNNANNEDVIGRGSITINHTDVLTRIYIKEGSEWHPISPMPVITCVIDKTKPSFSNLQYNKTGSSEPASSTPVWHNNSITASVEINDTESGIKKVAISDTEISDEDAFNAAVNNAKMDEPDDSQAKAIVVPESADNKYAYTFSEEEDKTYYFCALDNVGNVNNKAIQIKIDKTEPEVTRIDYYVNNNKLTFPENSKRDENLYGYVGKSSDKLEVEVDVKDELVNGACSKGDRVILYAYSKNYPGGKEIQVTPNSNNPIIDNDIKNVDDKIVANVRTFRFEISSQEASEWTQIKAKAYDVAGNASDITDRKEAERNNAFFEILLSDTKPIITTQETTSGDYPQISDDDPSYTKDGINYRSWYKDRTIGFNVKTNDGGRESDPESGLESIPHTGMNSVEIKVNSTKIIDESYSDYSTTNDEFNIQLNADSYTVKHGEAAEKTESISNLLNEGKNRVTVKVVNNNNEEASSTYYFYRDADIPEFTAVSVEKKVTSQVLSFLSFGVFSNDKIEFSLTAKDNKRTESALSGLKTITLYCMDGSSEVYSSTESFGANINSGTLTFTLPASEEFENSDFGNVYAVVSDNVGNETDKTAVDTINDSDAVRSNRLILEKTPPTISSSSLDTPDNADANTKTVVRDEKGNPTKWYASDNIDILVEYMDSGIHSGLYESSLTLNGDYIIQNAEEGETPKKSHRIYHKYAADGEQAYTEMTEESNFLINAGNAVTHNDDGSYNLKATVRDNAGNKGADYEETFYIDRDAPNVIDFEFDREYYQEPVDGNRGAEKNKAEVKNYGYYFNDATTVTITADDSDGPSSGVKSITVRFINHDGKIACDDVTADVDENNQASFEVPEGFKGQIIACATDNVNHTGDFVTPDGVIYEVNKPDIAFNDPTFAKKDKTDTGVKSKEQAPYVLNKISNGLSKQEVKAKKNNTYYKNELFNSNAYLPFVIDDAAIKDSGIRKIEWSITAKSAKNELASGYYTIDNNRKFDEKVNKGNNSKLASISIDHKKDEKNLVHRVTGKFLIGDDYNDIIVSITVTDRSGNTRTKSKVISVDKTAPKIKLEFADKDKETGKYSSYYNKDREAIITVKERNFDPARIDYIIDNIDKDYSSSPDISKSIVNIKNWSCEWKKSKDNKTHGYSVSNPDNSTYVYRIKFKVDKNDGNGDFKLRFNLQDMAHNKSNKAMSDFVLDGIDPTIKVTYSDKGKNKKNANYFNEDVTITVLVTEHNINVGEFNKLFKNLIDQVNNGDKKKKISQPKFSGFKHVGKDQYEATVVCKENARYFINMSIEDMAGNIFTLAEKRTKKDWYQFDVDHDKPEIEFGGDVKDLDKYEFASYNNQKFVPVITITDKDGNLDDVIDSKSFVIRTKGTLHREQTYDYFASSDEMKIEKVTNGYRFTLNYFEPKSYELDDVYVMEVVAVDKAGNEIKSNPQYFSVNRYGSTYKYDLLDIRFDEDALFNDILYTKAFVKKNNPVTVFTEYNCDNIKTNETELKLVYTNTNQQTEKEIELKENVNYIVVPDKNNKKTFNTKQYAYQLIDEELFNEDGVYEIYATTKDAAKNTNKNTVAVEKVNKTRRIIKFVVDNTAPRMDAKSTFEKIDYIDNNIYDIDTSNQKSQIRDDMFSSDGSSCTFKVSIDEENLGLDAIDVSKLNVNFDNKKIVVKDTDIVDENGVYDVSFKLDAPDNLTKTGDLVISIKDRAGLERVWSAKGLQISNNWFIRFINNKLALGITISIIVLIALGISVFFIVKRRKERDDEE